VWGDIHRSKPITVEWSVFAQQQTSKPVKGMLIGPVTILNWSFPREDISLKTQALPSVDEIVNTIHKIIDKVPQENVWVNPDCGLKTRGETETTASLRNLVAAAKQLRAGA
jgi:methionine synthase II (cobalamin-independent)